MDPTVLAAAAATSLIGALTTDAWERASSAIAALWRRQPHRAQAIEDELVEVRQEILAARQDGGTETEEGLVADWQRRLRRLLESDTAAAEELQRILNEVLNPVLSHVDQGRVEKIVMEARASGHGRVFQAGRDMRITGQ
jgi:hypothetical protein